MKILIDAHAAIQKKTGIGRYTDNLIAYLPKISKRGVNLSLYTHPPTPRKYSRFPSYQAPFKNGVFRVFWGLNRAILKLGPDMVHISNFAPLVKTLPVVMTVHDVCFKTCPKKYPFKTRLAFRLFFERSLKLSNTVICVSESVKSELLRLYHIDPNKLCVIYEAADLVFGYVKDRKKVYKKLKNKFGLSKEFFLVVGNIEPRKKPLENIDAFLKLKNKNIQLVFAGPNLLKNSELAKNKNEIKSGRIKILEFVNDNDLNLLYNGASALICNSYCEGFGLPILEAMRCKTPVICSNLKVFKEIASSSAIFIKDKKELAQAMVKILSSKSFRQKYALLGYKRSRAFSWDKAAKETLKVYRQILGEA